MDKEKYLQNISALEKAEAIGVMAAEKGFDWRDNESVFDKIAEEGHELRQAMISGDKTHMIEEFGDVLFSWVNLARKLNINAEQALNGAIIKFSRRFSLVEGYCEKQNLDMKELSLDDLNKLWRQAKDQLKAEEERGQK